MDEEEALVANTDEDAWYDYEGEEDFPEIIRAKWSMDGSSTLTEAAESLESFASALRQLEQDGWQLNSTIEDDYGFISHPELKHVPGTD